VRFTATGRVVLDRVRAALEAVREAPDTVAAIKARWPSAAAVAFLASDEASFITGRTLVADGSLSILDYTSQSLLEQRGSVLFSGMVGDANLKQTRRSPIEWPIMWRSGCGDNASLIDACLGGAWPPPSYPD
jgi:hypothetical protein